MKKSRTGSLDSLFPAILIPIATAYFVLYGGLYLIIYYSQFGIPIIYYVGIGELILYFLKDVTTTVIFVSTLVIGAFAFAHSLLKDHDELRSELRSLSARIEITLWKLRDQILEVIARGKYDPQIIARLDSMLNDYKDTTKRVVLHREKISKMGFQNTQSARVGRIIFWVLATVAIGYWFYARMEFTMQRFLP